MISQKDKERRKMKAKRANKETYQNRKAKMKKRMMKNAERLSRKKEENKENKQRRLKSRKSKTEETVRDKTRARSMLNGPNPVLHSQTIFWCFRIEREW